MNRAQMYHDMTDVELRAKYSSLKQELFNLRFQHATGQLKNPLMLKTVKKDIARVMTILKERELRPTAPGGKAAKTAKVASAGGKK